VDGITAQRKKEQLLMKVLQQQAERLEEEKLQLKLEVSASYSGSEPANCTVSRGQCFIFRLRACKLYSLKGEDDLRSPCLQKLNSMTLVCERTIPTERPPLVGEVSANFN
jgi:hypothetical protein